jgi:hypothetical protein
MMTLFQSGIHFIFNFVSTLLSLGRVAVADWRQIGGRLAADCWVCQTPLSDPFDDQRKVTKLRLFSISDNGQ